MPGRKAKKAVGGVDFSDWFLHSPEDWALLLFGMLGFVNLLPSVDLGVAFDYAWPIVVVVIGLKKLIDRERKK